MKFTDLLPGQSCTITGYTQGDSTYRHKLLSLGLTRGTRIDIKNIAPFGDPVEVEARGYRLSLRKDEASILQVQEV